MKNVISQISLSIGSGFMLTLFTIVPVMAGLDFLIPGGFHASFNDFFPRWFIVCFVGSFIYLWRRPFKNG